MTRRLPETLSATFSITFDAPTKFVYDWCTDFREDDVRIVGWSSKRHILEKTRRRVVWISHYNLGGEAHEAVRIVMLKPPDSWHLDGLGDDVDEYGDYKLRSLGKNKTRLTIKFRIVYKDKRALQSKEQWLSDMAHDWGLFKRELESDFKALIPSS